MMSTGVFASDVYIDQAGSSTTIDITQTGTGNSVGSSGTVSTIVGDTTDVDITQTGAGNTADIIMSTGTSITTLDYKATGGTNVLNVDIDGASGTTATITKTGDSNEVTVCGTIGTPGSIGTSASCTNGVQANDTATTIAITGDSNKVAVGLDAANAVNNITVGGNVISSNNVVNLSQSGTNTPNVQLNVDGDSNAINITQQ
tara:strand:+ start:216 stop:821 length:606 start_codon:yes stop_codon:yes gene_type:complete